MALATRCPHCNTAFKVAADQLKLRGGIVRCGACNEVFDGNAALVSRELPAPEAPTPAPSEETGIAVAPSPFAELEAPASDAKAQPEMHLEPEPEPAPEAEAEIEPASEPSAAQGIEQFYTLDFDTAPDPSAANAEASVPAAEPEAESTAPEAEPAPVQEAASELLAAPAPEPIPEPLVETEIRLRPPAAPDSEPAVDHNAPGLPVPDEEIVAAAPPDEAPDPAVLLARESAPGEPIIDQAADVTPRPAPRKGGRKVKPRPAPRPVTLPEPVEPEHEEPEFVRRSREQEQSARIRGIVLAAGSVLLVAALLVQGATTFRNVLAAQFPQLKPLLVATCSVFKCRVELPAQIEQLSVETGQLEALSGSSFVFSTVLHNQGKLVQTWPHLELALTDADNKTVLRRVLTPAQYLPKEVAPARGFAGGAEQPIRISFELDQIKASGYRIAVFYP